ncbi:hypothetical protein FOL46_000513, partial [Perkinsus olseni]
MARDYRVVEDSTRKAILTKFKEGGNGWLKFAKDLGVKRTTAYQIVKKGSDKKGKWGGRREKTVKVTAEITARLLAAVEQNASITLKALREKVNGAVSTSTIDRVLDGSLLTLKKITPVPVDKNSPQNIAKRAVYCRDYQGEVRKKIHIDESNYNLWTRRNYGRSRLGERAKKKERTAKGRNLNILLAISDDGDVVHHEVHPGSVTDKFRDFMGSVCNALDGERAVIYMDNAPIHKKLSNFELVPENVEVRRFDSPYSPELNPCEGCFSVLKAFIKGKLSERDPMQDRERAEEQQQYLYQYREDLLRGLCVEAMEQLTRDKIRGMYRLADTWV